MVTISLDQITRNVLRNTGRSLHWYMQYIGYGKDCLRELCMDDLQVFNSKIIPVDTNSNLAEIPADYLDFVLVGIYNNGVVYPLVESDSVDNLNTYNSDWEYSKLPDTATTSIDNPAMTGWWGFGQWLTTHYNNLGEGTGRYFGGIAYYDTFKILKNSNKIKLNNSLTFSNLVLVYISNGMDSNTATRINPYAQKTIETYIIWQYKENTRSYSDTERELAKNDYIYARSILRARMSDLSLSKLRRIVNKNTMASPKS